MPGPEETVISSCHLGHAPSTHHQNTFISLPLSLSVSLSCCNSIRLLQQKMTLKINSRSLAGTFSPYFELFVITKFGLKAHLSDIINCSTLLLTN